MPGFEFLVVMSMVVLSGGTSTCMMGYYVYHRVSEGSLVLPTLNGMKVNEL